MINKEKNFISAVVYLHNDEKNCIDFFSQLNQNLEEHFEHYEIIAVNDACTDETITLLKKWAAEHLFAPLTVVNMSLYQGVEAAMNAGLDASIGDFVYEFDCVSTEYTMDLAWQAYQKSLQGFDIVNVSPKNTTGSSKIFYRLFNRFSKSTFDVWTDAFKIVSRRAINRTHSISNGLAYRKAAYASCGLAVETIYFDGKIRSKDEAKLDKATESLILYTDAGYKVSVGASLIMLALTLIAAVYTIAIWATGNPIQGWTTTMLLLSVGFLGVVSLLTIVVKYLNILIKLNFKKKEYLTDSIDKIQR